MKEKIKKGTNWVDFQIKEVKKAINRSRAMRVTKGKATGWEMFWFGKGFGRGRYAGLRLILLLLALGMLYLIKEVFSLSKVIKGKGGSGT